MTAPPRLETERLVLRAHDRADLPEVQATWSDPAVVRFIGGRPCTEEEAWARMLRYAGHWPLLGFGFWRIGERTTDRYLGDVGFFDGRRGLGPRFDGAPEVGWTLAAHAHGRGLATEALRAVFAWGDAHLGSGRTVCMISPDNTPSLKVAARFGFTARRLQGGGGRPVRAREAGAVAAASCEPHGGGIRPDQQFTGATRANRVSLRPETQRARPWPGPRRRAKASRSEFRTPRRPPSWTAAAPTG
jgi:RimJ/RimL family protein N-acetyltransferase